MTPAKFIKRCNLVIFFIAFPFVLEQVLPLSKTDAEVTKTSRPANYVRDKIKYSSEEVIIHTTEGNIRVPPNHLNIIREGDDVVVYKTVFFRKLKRIHLLRQDKTIDSINLLYRWFIFLPVVMTILAVATVRVADNELAMNLGSGNLVIGLVALYMLLRDYVS
ncbi:MAG: hypothetical protein ACMVP2_14485 [Imperialibacter sp.]|uniref:hypothetical protein n=1 Tax=Imperialibacter sp. TaxID=2038411 RepID=UPI003A869336